MRVPHLAALAFVLAWPVRAEVGSAGPVSETGGPVHVPAQATTKGGPVYESRLPAGTSLSLPLSGLPVSSGRQGVAGSGSVRDGSVGSVADLGQGGDSSAPWFPPLGVAEEQHPTSPPPEEGLLSVIRSVQPLPREEEVGQSPEAESPEPEPHERAGEDGGPTGAPEEGQVQESALPELEPHSAPDR